MKKILTPMLALALMGSASHAFARTAQDHDQDDKKMEHKDRDDVKKHHRKDKDDKRADTDRDRDRDADRDKDRDRDRDADRDKDRDRDRDADHDRDNNARRGDNDGDNHNTYTGNHRTPDIRFTRQPVIEFAGDRSAVIAWSTNVGAATVLHYGTDPNNLSQTARAPWGTGTHRVKLSNLKPGTKYYYRADSGQAQGTGENAASAEGSFTTKSH